ncbi:Crp/Fnr family transcriptional regulator [sulfur-oxidizing endosymbiont of Gigantopelta aegis]|uniref:Crp/Fnr family transcriptional regulator n=1 Tax=sulfur-oxidizing endosymbiont of Gigantopelta aegis TaxID=2794934 RepID=UPI0018DC09A6|nr:Crp/Fnr family transcriptional regulator [sulfur-oxidizing endosymbiont of Gigantopelta aegis]
MELKNTILQLFPRLADASDKAGNNILSQAQQMTIPKGTTLFRHGDQCQNYLLVISGSVKVITRAENGREVVLYHITRGGSCVLTTSCLMSSENYPAEGVTETDIVALAIAKSVFEQYMAESKAFRQQVFRSYGDRLIKLITLVEEISFAKLDIRLAKFLLKNGSVNTPIRTTHQALATELGSAREVISRQLKEFENKGWVQLNRGKIEIMNHDALATL